MPSSVWTLTEYDGLVSKSKDSPLNNLSPVIVKLPLSESPVPATNVYVWVSWVSTSVDVNVPISVPIGEFSSIVEVDKVISVGASLTAVTVIVKVPTSVNAPSDMV